MGKRFVQRRRRSPVREVEFQEFLENLFRKSGKFDVHSQISLGEGLRPDILLSSTDKRKKRSLILEVMIEPPLTNSRVEALIERIEGYKERFATRYPLHGDPEMAVAFLAPLSSDQFHRFTNVGLTVFGREKLKLEASLVGLGDDYEGLVSKFDQGIEESEPEPNIADLLRGKLDTVELGKEWNAYQALCTEILSYLFCPPLERPLPEHATESKVNRRDVVIPNYCMEGFFYFLRETYRADYIVADAKNYKSLVGKNQVLQIANYLSPHGAGLFGLIVTRKGANRSAIYTQREQWLYHQKLIMFLVDDDLRLMISMKRSGQDPTHVLRQKIEDFRLSI